MSYLAAPPETPIDIDANVEYKYVIAQNGAVAITPHLDSDFQLNLSMGEPAVLRIKYVGAIPTTPIFKTVNITVQLPGQIINTHSPQFRILPQPPSTRMVPAIINGIKINAIAGQNVSFAITTDITADSFDASNLPGSLSINTSTGGISGAVPSVDGFYVVTLRANLGTLHHLRYFVVIVGTGGFPPPAPLPPTVHAPQVFLDGDFSEAQVAGPAEWEIPFKADPTPYIYKLKYWQLRENYAPMPIGTVGPLGGFYCGESTGTTKIIGGGVIEFERRFCIVPNSRSEYESFVYGIHFQFYTFGLPNVCTETFPLTLNSRVQFDYFMTDDPDTIDLPRAPAFVQSCLGTMAINGALSSLLPPLDGAPIEILAEDAQLKIWEFRIYERKMRFVKPPTSLELLS